METRSYPNYDVYINAPSPRNTDKWLQAAREIYYQIHKGVDHNKAFECITNNWNDMEKFDFKNWLRFYESGNQNKYKQAQVFWGDQNAGYFLPIQKERKPDMDVSTITNSSTHPDMVQEEKRRIIEKQRQKIIGRLDSAEKLLRSHEGQVFAGNEYEQLVEILYQLKKKIQMVNKISTSTKLYKDMIIREANILSSKGYKEASSFLVKVAQTMPSPSEAPNPASIGEGQAGTLPGQAPGEVPPGNNAPIDITMPDVKLPGAAETDNVSRQKSEPQDDTSLAMKQFLEGLESANKSPEEDELKAEAQEATPHTIEVAEDPEVQAGSDFDSLLDQTLGNITVADVVAKLEDVSKIFKTREISRQLAIADIMLDKLGLAAFFPELNESIQKSSEMSGYINSRVESILTKLRGTLPTKEIDLKNEGAPPPSQTAQQLQSMEEKEKAKKQMRKEVEEQKSLKPTPEIEVSEDLAQPAALQSAAPSQSIIPTPARIPTR